MLKQRVTPPVTVPIPTEVFLELHPELEEFIEFHPGVLGGYSPPGSYPAYPVAGYNPPRACVPQPCAPV